MVSRLGDEAVGRGRVGRFELCWGDHADLAVEASVVKPVDVSSVAISTSSIVRQGPRRWISSVL